MNFSVEKKLAISPSNLDSYRIQRHLKTREDPKLPLSEEMALVRCLKIFTDLSPSDFSSQDLSEMLLEMGLTKAAREEMTEKMSNETSESSQVVDVSSVSHMTCQYLM